MDRLGWFRPSLTHRQQDVRRLDARKNQNQLTVELSGQLYNLAFQNKVRFALISVTVKAN